MVNDFSKERTNRVSRLGNQGPRALAKRERAHDVAGRRPAPYVFRRAENGFHSTAIRISSNVRDHRGEICEKLVNQYLISVGCTP